MTGIKGRRWGADVYLDPSIDIGAIPYKGANGKLLWLTPGAVDQVLTSNGLTPSIPTYEDGSGGGGGSGATKKLGVYTAANQPTLDCATRNVTGTSGDLFQSDFDRYYILIESLFPVTSNVDIYWRLSTDSGATYDGNSRYAYTNWLAVPGGNGQNGTTPAAPGDRFVLNVGGNGVITTANYGLCSEITILNANRTDMYKRAKQRSSYVRQSDSSIAATVMEGAYHSLLPITALNFFCNAGNLLSGSVTVYALA